MSWWVAAGSTSASGHACSRGVQPGLSDTMRPYAQYSLCITVAHDGSNMNKLITLSSSYCCCYCYCCASEAAHHLPGEWQDT